MAESVVVADNVELVANNIQKKVGGSLIGMRNLAQESTGSPVNRAQKSLVQLQEQTVAKITEVWEVLKSQLEWDKEEARRARQEAKELAMEQNKKAPGAGIGFGKGLVDDEGGNAGADAVKSGLAGAAGGLASGFGAKLLSKIFSPVSMAVAGVAWAIVDGMRGMDAWGDVHGKVPAFIGGMLGGMDSGISGMFKNMGKFALIGAAIGSVFPVIGTLIGGLVGAAIGGLLGFIGGEKIAEWAKKIGDMTLKDLFDPVVTWYKNISTAVGEKLDSMIETVKDVAGKIFAPIKWAFAKIKNGIKHMINFYIDGINKLLPKKYEIDKLEIEPEGSDDENVQKSKELTTDTSKLATAATDETVTNIPTEDVSKVLSDSDKMLADINAKAFAEDSKYARTVLIEINKSAENLRKIADSGKVSVEDAKALKVKADEMQSSIQKNIDDIEQLALEKGEETNITQLLPETLKLESGDVDTSEIEDIDKLKSSLTDKRAMLEQEIEALELKASQFPKQKGWKVQANNRRREIESIDRDMTKIGSFLEDYQLELMDTKSDSAEALKTNQKVIKKLDLVKKDSTEGQSVTVMGGSPTIQSQKVNNMISSSGIYPVDPSLLVALASAQKG